ncbi:MAG: ArsS family sensor histidine kinase [Epsilonproteobacteria bacterium]|nr:ArsS family sensor histidine kinase [Campylobacterota bacterium]
MKINSLYTKIKLIFVVLTLLLTALFASYFFISMGKQMMQMQKRYMGASKVLHRYYQHNNTLDIDTFLEHSHLKIIDNKALQQKVLTEGKSIRRKHMPPPHLRFKIFKLNEHYYLYIKRHGFEIFLEDTQTPTPPFHLIGWYILSLFLVILFYFWITKSLNPLKELQQQIKKVGEGDLSLSLKRTEGDEISDVANEFDNALRKIEALINSRQLFMRTIMHELKTPIAKGRIVTEMVEDSLTQQKYETIFERLELLIEEFSQIEQMLSSSYTLKQNTYNIYDILDQAIELLILDDEAQEQIAIEVQKPFSLYTDFNLLALAIKNLLDNALKYSMEPNVKVVIDSSSITIINQAEPLNSEIESFFKPFHQQTDTTKGGLGLGLYIVKSIVERLKLTLEYNYIKGRHHFIISDKN